MSEQYKPVYGVLLAASVQCIPAQWSPLPSGQHDRRIAINVKETLYYSSCVPRACVQEMSKRQRLSLLSLVQITNADMGIINNGSHVEAWLPSISIFFG